MGVEVVDRVGIDPLFDVPVRGQDYNGSFALVGLQFGFDLERILGLHLLEGREVFLEVLDSFESLLVLQLNRLQVLLLTLGGDVQRNLLTVLFTHDASFVLVFGHCVYK